MMEFVEPGLRRDIQEYDRGIVHKSARRDRPRLGVFHRGMRRAGCNSHAWGGFGFLALLLAVGGERDGRNQEENQNARRCKAQPTAIGFQVPSDGWHCNLAAA